MNECEHTDRLSAYHDGELDPATRAEVQRHLAQCPPCAAELARLVRLSGALAGLGNPTIDPRAMQRLHQRLDVLPLPSLAIGRLAAALTAVAASILLACGAWLWASSSPAGTASMPVWETAVLQKPAEPAPSGSEDRLAVWIVQDLSREGGNDQE